MEIREVLEKAAEKAIVITVNRDHIWRWQRMIETPEEAARPSSAYSYARTVRASRARSPLVHALDDWARREIQPLLQSDGWISIVVSTEGAEIRVVPTLGSGWIGFLTLSWDHDSRPGQLARLMQPPAAQFLGEYNLGIPEIIIPDNPY